jgi:hypothetical protein
MLWNCLTWEIGSIAVFISFSQHLAFKVDLFFRLKKQKVNIPFTPHLPPEDV